MGYDQAGHCGPVGALGRGVGIDQQIFFGTLARGMRFSILLVSPTRFNTK